MSLGKLWPALMLVWLARATLNASDPCGEKFYIRSSEREVNLTFSTQEDARIANSCKEIYPNLVIDKSFPGIFRLESLEVAHGSIYVGKLEERPRIESSTLTGLDFPKLEQVGNVAIYGVSSFTSLKLPAVVTLGRSLSQNGGLSLADVPSLVNLEQLPNLRNISDILLSNTGMKSFVWKDVFPGTTGVRSGGYEVTDLNSFQIGNSTNLDNVDLVGLRSASTLSVYGNGNTKLKTSDIESSWDLKIAGIKSLAEDGFIPSYRKSSNVGNLRIVNNTFDVLVHKNITELRDLEIRDNPNLQYFSFPKLADMNDLDVVGNGALKVINQSTFGYSTGNYTWVRGDINLTGVFTEISWKPPLTPQRVTIFSTGEARCDQWDDEYLHKQFSRSIPYNCTTAGPKYTPPPRTDLGGGGGGGRSTTIELAPGIIAGIVVSVVSTIIWCLVMWWWCVRHRRRKRERQALLEQVTAIASALENRDQQKPPSPSSNGVVETREIKDTSNRGTDSHVSYPSGLTSQELDGVERGEGVNSHHTSTPAVAEMPTTTQLNELSENTRLSRAEALAEETVAAFQAREAALRQREEALQAREREMEEIERQRNSRPQI